SQHQYEIRLDAGTMLIVRLDGAAELSLTIRGPGDAPVSDAWMLTVAVNRRRLWAISTASGTHTITVSGPPGPASAAYTIAAEAVGSATDRDRLAAQAARRLREAQRQHAIGAAASPP